MAKNKTPVNPFDQIVDDVIQKSTVTAPSDPNGGAKLPERQKDQPAKKRRDKESYMAIFDREAQASDDQLDEWERDTNALTESPDKFVNDDDDTPKDPDEADEDARGNEEYDALADDEDEEGDDEDEGFVRVKAHKRRIKKAVHGDHADENEALSDEDDDDDLDEGDDDEDEDEGDRGPRKPIKPSAKDGERAKDERRRREVKKALGKDVTDMVDASPLVKALVDAVYDLRDDTLTELRQHVSTLRRQNKALASRIASLEGNVRQDMRSMTKSLTAGVAQMVLPATPDDGSRDPVRKGYGAPVATRPRFPGGQGFDWAKGADVLQKALEDGVEGVRNTDITLIETDKTPQYLSPGAQQVLRKANLIS